MRGLKTGFPLSEHQRTLVSDLKTYLDDTFGPEQEGPIAAGPEWADDEEYERATEYNRQLSRDGWLIPHWPVEYGGRGWDAVDQMLIREELAYRRVPIVNINGLDMLAPILMQFGTEEQRQQYLPGIANVETVWAQGYSEPDAGSDLGSLRTRAERSGDHYILNGSKTWTGSAMRADWMFVLCRTDPESTGTRGLSLILCDLHNTPGVEVQPIRSMTGAVTFGLEFFNDARVPAANLLGEEGAAWESTRALLEVERTGVGKTAGRRRHLDDMLDLLHGIDGRGLGQSARIQLGQFIEEVESGRALAYSAAAAAAAGTGMPPHMPSVLKVYLSDLGARLAEFAVETLGLEAAEFRPEAGTWNFWDDYLYSLLFPIAGGANEVQHEIIGLRRYGIRRS